MERTVSNPVGDEKSQNMGLHNNHRQRVSQSSVPREQLHFINVSDPITLKSAASKKTVRSYVARATHQKFRRDRVIHFEQSKQTETQSEPPSKANQSPVEEGEVVPREPSQRYLKTLIPTTHLMARPAYRPADALSSAQGDPFQSCAVQLTSFEHYLVYHFMRFVIPQSAAYYPRSRVEPGYQEGMTLQWVPFAITEPGVMNGLFLLACHSLALLYNNDFYLRHAFKYNEKCIRSINEAISEEGTVVSDSTIVKVLLLSSAEFHAGNIGGTRNHADAIGEMVRLKGGLQNLGLGGFLRQLVLWHDRTSTSYIGTSPKFIHQATFEENASIECLSPGFIDRLDLSQLSIDMINILNDMCAYTDSVNSLPYPWSEPDHRNLSSTGNELEVRLLVLSSEYQNVSSTRIYSSVEECLFLSLRVFMNLMPHESSFPPLGCKHLAARINSILSEIMLLPSWYQCADLLLWMTFMGSIVAQAGIMKEQTLCDLFVRLRKQVDIPPRFEGGTGDDASFLVFKLVEICSVLGTSSKEDMKAHLQRFLWVEILCEKYSLDIWSNFDVMAMVLGYSKGILRHSEL